MAFGDFSQVNSIDAGTVSSQALAYSSNNAGGNVLSVVARVGSTVTITSISDTRSNTWALGKRNASGTDHACEVWYSLNCGSGANTVTLNLSGAATLRFIIQEHEGNGASVEFHGTPSAGNGIGTSMDSGPLTTTLNDVLLLGGNTHNHDISGSVITATGSFTERSEVAERCQSQDRVVSTTGSYNSTATIAFTETWSAVIIAVANTGGGSGAIKAPMPYHRKQFFYT